MWILLWLKDRIGSIFDIGKDMEWYSMYSPILSALFLAVSALGAYIAPLPPAWIVYPSVPIVLFLGYIAGDKFQHKLDDDPAEESILKEMAAPMPWIQFQTLVVAIWLADAIFVWRIVHAGS